MRKALKLHRKTINRCFFRSLNNIIHYHTFNTIAMFDPNAIQRERDMHEIYSMRCFLSRVFRLSLSLNRMMQMLNELINVCVRNISFNFFFLLQLSFSRSFCLFWFWIYVCTLFMFSVCLSKLKNWMTPFRNLDSMANGGFLCNSRFHSWIMIYDFCEWVIPTVCVCSYVQVYCIFEYRHFFRGDDVR